MLNWPNYNDADTAPVNRIWVLNGGPEKGALSPYVKNLGIYVCPSDRRGHEKLLSYSVNHVMSFIPDAVIQRPAEVVLLVDEQRTLNDGYFVAPPNDCPSIVHNNGATFSFADSHAKWYRVLRPGIRGGDCPDVVPIRLFCPYIPFPWYPYCQ